MTRSMTAAMLLVLAVATSCRSGDRSAASVPPAPSDTGAIAAAGFEPSSVRLRLKPFVGGLLNPLGVTHAADGTKWLYVLEQDGLIKLIRDGRVVARPFLDLTPVTDGGGEQGLLGLAFHPEYETNGRLYVNYTDTNGDTVIAEYTRSSERRSTADAGSARVLLTYDQPFSNHNGGALAFGPDGYLYISSGDGGGAGDPMGNGQRTDTLLGKLLRIDVDSASGGRAYGIPPDNPFTGDPLARPEIWAYGLRNPWRIAFDRRRGDLWIADVGQNAWEEINRELADYQGGGNYGWNVKEGSRCFPSGGDCEGVGEGFIDPITEYNHEFGCSITGGYVYRGSRYPAMRGGYFFGDFCSGNIWAVKAGGRSPQEPVLLLESGRPISSYGETAGGELLLVDYSGEILKVAGSSGQ